MGAVTLSKKTGVSQTTPFNLILEMLVNQDLGFIDLENTTSLPLEETPQYIQDIFSFPPWSITPEHKEYLMSLKFDGTNPELNKIHEKNAEEKLRTKPRTYRNIGRIALFQGEWPLIHEWDAYQEHRFAEFEKQEIIRDLIREYFPKVRLSNRRVIPIYRGDENRNVQPLWSRGFEHILLDESSISHDEPVKAFLTPYVKLRYFTKIDELMHDIIDVNFSGL